MSSDSPTAPGLPQAVQAVRQLGGVFLSPDAAQLLAMGALAAARLHIMAEIYHDLADNDELDIPDATRAQLDAVGWYLREEAHRGN